MFVCVHEVPVGVQMLSCTSKYCSVDVCVCVSFWLVCQRSRNPDELPSYQTNRDMTVYPEKAPVHHKSLKLSSRICDVEVSQWNISQHLYNLTEKVKLRQVSDIFLPNQNVDTTKPDPPLSKHFTFTGSFIQTVILLRYYTII